MLDILFDPPSRNPGEKPFKWIVIDSAILAGIAFAATLPSARAPTLEDIYLAVRAFLYAFLVQLGIERGLKPVVKKQSESEANTGES